MVSLHEGAEDFVEGRDYVTLFDGDRDSVTVEVHTGLLDLATLVAISDGQAEEGASEDSSVDRDAILDNKPVGRIPDIEKTVSKSLVTLG